MVKEENTEHTERRFDRSAAAEDDKAFDQRGLAYNRNGGGGSSACNNKREAQLLFLLLFPTFCLLLLLLLLLLLAQRVCENDQ